MAITVVSDQFNPQLLAETVRGRFAKKNAFFGSTLVSSGGLIVNDTFDVRDPSRIGTTVTMPYFGTLGAFSSNPDGSSSTPQKLSQGSESASVARESLSFEISRWAKFGGTRDRDVYEEAADQILVQATRAMDRLSVAEASNSPLVYDAYSATSPSYISYDTIVNAIGNKWGDEQEDIVALVTHSQGKTDFLKLRDSTGRPLLTPGQTFGEPDRVAGIPILVSDSMPLTGSTMGTVVAAGTSPPTITLSGTPTGPWNLKIKVIAGGALATWTLQFSTDGGNTWSATKTSAASVALDDTSTVDSLVGNNGVTGITAAIGAGTANVDNTWTSNANLKCTTQVVKRGALAFWYNRMALELLVQPNILADSNISAMHLYYAAKCYRRVPTGTKPGVLLLKHNVTNYIG